MGYVEFLPACQAARQQAGRQAGRQAETQAGRQAGRGREVRRKGGREGGRGRKGEGGHIISRKKRRTAACSYIEQPRESCTETQQRFQHCNYSKAV